jgi:hypothetical protein
MKAKVREKYSRFPANYITLNGVDINGSLSEVEMHHLYQLHEVGYKK